MNPINPFGVKFKYRGGVEFTSIHPEERRGIAPPLQTVGVKNVGGMPLFLADSYYGYRQFMYRVHERVFNDETSIGHIHDDPGCVEWSSPIAHSWEDVHGMWEYWNALTEMVGLVQDHPDVGGGMGHIHLSPKSKQLTLAVQQDIMYRPYVAWAFCDPSAIEYCSPKYRAQGVPKLLDVDLDSNERVVTDKYIDIRVAAAHRSRTFGSNTDFHTLEFRFFNSASSWDEQYLHMAFAQKYLQLIADGLARGYVPSTCLPPMNPFAASWEREPDKGRICLEIERQYAKNFDACAREFKALIEVMGLPWSAYEHYLDVNLRPQLKWGTRGARGNQSWLTGMRNVAPSPAFSDDRFSLAA